MFSQVFTVYRGKGGSASRGRRLHPGGGGLHPGGEGDLHPGGGACIQGVRGVCIQGVGQTPHISYYGIGQQVGGAHPTRMHSCLLKTLSMFLFMVKKGGIIRAIEILLNSRNYRVRYFPR